MDTVMLNGLPLVLLIAAGLTIVYKLGDSYIMRHKIHDDDELVAMLTFLTVGATVGLLVNFLLLQTPVGKMIDSSFTSLVGISSDAMWLAIASGVMGAISTAVYLWAFRKSVDPSLVIPLSALSIVYIAAYELLIGRVALAAVGLPVFLAIAGVFVALIGGVKDWRVAARTIVLLLLVHNGASALGELLSKSGVDLSDAASFSFYRFLSLTVAAWVLTIAAMKKKGSLSNYVVSLRHNFKSVPVVTGQMVLVFFAVGWGTKGLALSDATTKNVVMSLPIVLVVIASAAINRFSPGTFEEKETSLLGWFARLSGAVLMMVAVVLLK